MTLTDVATIDCEQQETPAAVAEDRISIWRLPKLLWAGVALFAVNAIIGAGMFLTPNLVADMYGNEVRATSAVSLKPSPFTEVIDATKRKVQVAAKLRPVLFDPAPLMDYQVATAEASSNLSLDIPRVSRVAYELDLPVRTQPAVYESPRTDEKDKKFTVIN